MDRGYDDAVTAAFKEELDYLGVQSSTVSERAAEQVKGQWYTGHFIYVDTKRRHFDIGFDDGFVTPVVVPVAECEGIDPADYPIPSLKTIREYGFEVSIEMAPVVQKQLLKCIYPNENTDMKRINPEKHFGIIIQHIRKEAIEMYGPDYDIY